MAIHQKTREPSLREVMDSCFISICKFGSFKITSLPEPYFRFRRFILLVQSKKGISMEQHQQLKTMETSETWRNTSAEIPSTYPNPNIYINFSLNPPKKFTSSSILSQNISQLIIVTILISTRIVISSVMKQGILLLIWWKVNGRWDNNMIRTS